MLSDLGDVQTCAAWYKWVRVAALHASHRWLSAAGFLSARLSFTELIGFGLSLFINASNSARINLVKMGAPGLVGMLIELTRIR